MTAVVFTPGPWKAETIYSPSNGKEVEIAILSDDAEIAVIEIEDDGNPTDEELANGRLLAAAPAMYEALKEILGAIPVTQGGTQGAIRKRALAALAKVQAPS